MACRRRPPLASLAAAVAALLAFATAAETQSGGVSTQAEVVVQGVVYCQSCAEHGTWSLAAARPLPSAKVGVLCRDGRRKMVFYRSFVTDNKGYFYAPLRGLDLKGAAKPTSACVVYLLSSADRSCDLLTNVNSGITGAKLRETNETLSGSHYRAVIYSAGPLAFHPAYCAPRRHY